MTPLSAARAAMGVTPAPADPDAPGPFAFADEERLRAILSRAGFGAIDAFYNNAGVEGANRFLKRLWKFAARHAEASFITAPNPKLAGDMIRDAHKNASQSP